MGVARGPKVLLGADLQPQEYVSGSVAKQRVNGVMALPHSVPHHSGCSLMCLCYGLRGSIFPNPTQLSSAKEVALVHSP